RLLQPGGGAARARSAPPQPAGKLVPWRHDAVLGADQPGGPEGGRRVGVAAGALLPGRYRLRRGALRRTAALGVRRSGRERESANERRTRKDLEGWGISADA